MPAPSTLEARNLHREAQALIEQAAVQQAESSASCIRQQGSARDDGGAQGPEPSVHAGGAAERPANPGRTPAKERLLDTRGQAQDGDARNVINARRMSKAEARAAAGYHPRRGGRYDSDEDCSPTPEPPEPACSAGRSARQPSPSASASPQRSSSIMGRWTPVCGSMTTAWRVSSAKPPATRLSSATSPCTSPTRRGRGSSTCRPARSTTGYDLVRTFVGNFQGTYVRPGNSWDLRSCTQKPGESLRDFIRRFSKRCTELSNVA
jgi:hypothetical protein